MIWREFFQDQRGQDLVEYSLLMAFVCLVGAATYLGMTNSIGGLWNVTNTGLSAPLSTTGTAS